MAEITCNYLTLPGSGAQLHYRRAGSGPPLIMLHPSPQHSQVLEPAVEVFAQDFTCIALDTPGYGQSDDPMAENPSLQDYGEVVLAAADVLGIDRFYLYGAATGAQIAIEMGKHNPERLALVLLDANGHIDADERKQVTQGYFPPVTPHRDGRHLLTLWDMCSNLFARFPWNSTRPEDRLPLPLLPAEFVQATLLRYLDAGEGYAKAYREAFDAEDIAHLHGFVAQAVMTRWEGSAVLRIADDFIAQGLPDNVRLLRAGTTLEERYSVQLTALLDSQSSTPLDPLALQETEQSGAGRTYLPVSVGQLHAMRNDKGSGRTLVLLHEAGRSHDRWSDLGSALDGKRPYLAIDLPAHGHSRIRDVDCSSIAALAAPIMEALRDYPAESIELVGTGLGAAIALEVADTLPGVEVTLLDPLPYASCEAMPPVDLSPRDSGAHLVDAWHIVRQNAERWPWWSRSVETRREVPLGSSAPAMHAHVCDILRLGTDYPAMIALENGIGWDDMLTSANPVAIALTPQHPRPEFTSQLTASGHSLRGINDLAELFV